MRQLAKPLQFTKRTAALTGLGVIIVVAVVVALVLRKSAPATIPSTNPLGNAGQNNPSASPGQSSLSNAQTSNQNSKSGGSGNQPSGAPPITPFGDFVSNHHPGGGAPTSEASTCNTSPGAVCYIKFTKGSEAKQLNPQTTNGSGAAIWYWDVNSAGLSAGSWTITAVGQLNGQTRTATDSMALDVQ